MQVKEVEELLGITRANIRFYEKEGLLSPTRDQNGYRSYGQEDIKRLKEIILLRKLGIPLSDIRRVFDGETLLSDAIQENTAALEQQMKELQGALRLSKKMTEDASLNSHFDLEKYWKEMEETEEQGFAFLDILKDYAGFEKDVFYQMWNTAFLTDLRSVLKGKSFLACVGIVLFICIGRGLSYRYLWKIGTFIEGALEPLVVFVLLSVVMLPQYILNRKYGTQEKDKTSVLNDGTQTAAKKPVKGCLSLLIHIGIVICFCGLLVLGIPVLLEIFYFGRMNGNADNYMIASPVYVLYVIIALLVFFILFWMISSSDGQIYFCYLPRKMKIKVGIAAVLVYLLALGTYASVYDRIGEDGFMRKRFMKETYYTYDEVAYYQMYAQADGTLGYKLFFTDGTVMRVYQSSYIEDFDETLYPNGCDDYIVTLSKRLADRGVKLKLANEEKLYQRLIYDYWDDVAKKVIAVSITE